MYKKIIFFLLMAIFFSPIETLAQFNTILPKKKIDILRQEEKPLVDSIKIDTTFEIKEETKEATFDEIVPINIDSTSNDNLGLLSGYITLPLDTITITSKYGKRTPPCKGASSDHKGIDLNGNKSIIHAVMPGKIKKVGSNKALGNYIVIEHGDFITIYGHLSTILVLARQFVSAGQIIGITGSTGISTGDHLHFGMKYKNEYMDPEPFIMLAKDIMERKGKDLLGKQ